MEKLVLRGIMYGADKIPDSWFEKVPGGFYKPKEREREKAQKGEKRSSRSRRDRSPRRRHSGDEYDDRRSRYNDDDYDRERPGRTTDRRRRHARSQSHYDGGDDYDSEALEREREQDRRMRYDDDGRYGHDDGSSRRNDARHSYVPSQYPDSNMNAASKRDAAAAAAAGAGIAAAMAHQDPRQAPITSPPHVASGSGAVPASYIPYANIYGASGAHPQAAPQIFSPPPMNAFSPVQPNKFVPGASPIGQPGYPVPNTAYDQRGFPDSSYHSQSRRRDSQLQSSSPSSFNSKDKPRRTRSERRPDRDYEKSRADRRFVNPVASGFPPPPPPGPPSRSDPFTSSWQEITGHADDRYDSESRRDTYDRHRRGDDAGAGGYRSD